VRLLPVGDTALLVELPGLPDVLAVHATLAELVRSGRARWVEDLVPAERTVLIRFDPRAVTAAQVGDWVRRVPWQGPVAGTADADAPVRLTVG
jgi:allophanate hydrolase subunit 1